jgi:hypothetical protein
MSTIDHSGAVIEQCHAACKIRTTIVELKNSRRIVTAAKYYFYLHPSLLYFAPMAMIGCLLLVTYLIKRYDRLFIVGNLFNKTL